MPLIKAVIFDVDGVLVRTDELHFHAWSAIAKAEGIAFDRRTNDRMRGVSRMESLEILLERAMRPYPDTEKQSLADRKNTQFRASIETLSENDVVPGVKSLIAALRDRDVRIAAASSSRNARTILERLALAPHFDAIVDGNDITQSKPHPEVFLRAAGLLDVDPAGCVVIEDASAGVEAARRAGMSVIGVGDPQVLTDCDRVFAAVSEIELRSFPGVTDGMHP